MKKILALMLALCMVFALAACGEPASEPSDAPVSEAPEASEAPEGAKPGSKAPAKAELMGLTVEPLTEEAASKLGLPGDASGLLVTAVDGTSEAYTKGLREGDLITEAGQQKVVRIEDLEARIDEAREAGRKSILLLIRRGGDPRFVALSVE